MIACVFSKRIQLKMLIHIPHKKIISLQCVFACIFNVDLSENAEPHTSQKMVYFKSIFAYELSLWMHQKILFYILHKKRVSLQSVFTCVSSVCHFLKQQIHTLHKKMVSLQHVFAYVFS